MAVRIVIRSRTPVAARAVNFSPEPAGNSTRKIARSRMELLHRLLEPDRGEHELKATSPDTRRAIGPELPKGSHAPAANFYIRVFCEPGGARSPAKPVSGWPNFGSDAYLLISTES